MDQYGSMEVSQDGGTSKSIQLIHDHRILIGFSFLTVNNPFFGVPFF